ncbi:MAG: Flp pilus assembly protein CpaB [Candidatus Paracaedimonas acanthamoebae]|uniref:Flp pilus assembly protein CpaB n=1 Tax=Candidatus Paracaedimonas acanthamoebae TaxID=244581 RepID=A0A8J7TUK2_9PROT|nr:Flp pilus assembly protein CpaB [Candidatus Paracaedimonas acanthamoebae]
MRSKSILLVLGSLVFAVLLSLLLQSFFNKNNKSAAKKAQENIVLVLTAPTELSPGTIISVDKLVWKEWPTDALNPNYITKDKTEELKTLNGSTVRFAILANEPVKLSNVVSPGKSILSAIIRTGMRGVTIPFSKIANAPGFIAPGDLIDVVIPKRSQERGEGYFGQTIIKGVRILAVDRSLQNVDGNKSDQPKTMTLEVTADQAEDLAASIRGGEIVISLRSAFKGTLDENAAPVKVEQAPVDDKIKLITMIRGKDKSQVTFNE